MRYLSGVSQRNPNMTTIIKSAGIDWLRSAGIQKFHHAAPIRAAFFVATTAGLQSFCDEVIGKSRAAAKVKLLLHAVKPGAKDLLNKLKSSGQVEVRFHTDLHAKMLLLEGSMSGRVLVGSANLTDKAMNGDKEFNATIDLELTSPAWQDAVRWFDARWEKATPEPSFVEFDDSLDASACFPGLPQRKLFAYQKEAVESLKTFYEQEQRNTSKANTLVIMPTGSGKTAVAARWLVDLIHADPNIQAVWTARQHELLAQAENELKRAGLKSEELIHIQSSEEFGDLCGNRPRMGRENYRVLLMSSQFINRNGITCPSNIVIYDEAHHLNPGSRETKEVLKALDYHLLIGLTATPWRTDDEEQERFRELFGHSIKSKPREKHSPDIGHVFFLDERINKHLKKLVDSDNRAVLAGRSHTSFDTGFRFRFKTSEERRARLELEQRIKEFDTPKRTEAIAERYLGWRNEHPEIQRTLVFCCNAAHANNLGRILRNKVNQSKKAGALKIQVFHTGEIPQASSERYGDNIFAINGRRQAGKYRQDVINHFERGNIDVLVTVGLALEGLDLPRVDSVLVARPTLSSKLYRQMVGRGLRGPAVGGTKEVHVLDCVDQMEMHDKTIKAIYANRAYTKKDED